MLDAVLQLRYWQGMDDIYKRMVTYQFKAGGENWALICRNGPARDVHDGYAMIEETRKNGQEDSHCWGELYKRNGRWELEAEAAEQIQTYMGSAMVAKLEAFFDAHEPPLDFS